MLSALVACSNGGTGAVDTLAPCESGVSRLCTCPGGGVGSQTCAGGSFSPCLCKVVDGGSSDSPAPADSTASADSTTSDSALPNNGLADGASSDGAWSDSASSDSASSDSASSDSASSDSASSDSATSDGTPATDASERGPGCNGAASCDDGNDCTSDVCKGKTGCVHSPLDGTPCDADGSVCTTGDSCQAGVCTAGKTKDCDDQHPCTDDSCDKAKGCVNTPNSGACSDGNACTSGDSCGGGKCVGQAVACDDGNPCTVDGCSPQAGCTAAAMADGTPCGAASTCKAGACAAVAPVCGVGTVALPIDVGGVASVACGATGPVWGPRADTFGSWGPVVAGTVADPQTGLTWMTGMSPKQMNWNDARVWCDSLELGGQNDWRLPTWLELRTTLATNQIQLAVLEPPFSGTPWEPMVPSAWTWTGSTAPGKPDKAWALNYTFGTDLGMGKQTLAWARCVRGSVVGKPAGGKRFVISAAGGTVVDTWTNLTWQRSSKEYGSNNAVADTYCAKLQLEGDSWRLPTVTELAGLIDVTLAGVQTDGAAFPAVKPEYYWTKSPASGKPGSRWSCAFMEPAVCESIGYSNNAARCVR
jgi:hypothetical protein